MAFFILEICLNVLLIAPESGLSGAVNEVRAVSLALHPVVLNGHVTRKDVLDALSGHVWDIVWFACHGDQHGIMLSDAALPISDLTSITRNSGAKLIVLNSCSSRLVGLEIHYELGIDVVCTEADANDLTAYQAGTFLARNLASGMSVEDAFERSRPGQQTLYYLFSAHDGTEDAEARTISLMHDGFKRQETLIRQVEASILEQFGGLERRVLKVETATNVLERRNTPAIDRIMIMLMTITVLVMFGFNIYWTVMP